MSSGKATGLPFTAYPRTERSAVSSRFPIGAVSYHFQALACERPRTAIAEFRLICLLFGRCTGHHNVLKEPIRCCKRNIRRMYASLEAIAAEYCILLGASAFAHIRTFLRTCHGRTKEAIERKLAQRHRQRLAAIRSRAGTPSGSVSEGQESECRCPSTSPTRKRLEEAIGASKFYADVESRGRVQDPSPPHLPRTTLTRSFSGRSVHLPSTTDSQGRGAAALHPVAPVGEHKRMHNRLTRIVHKQSVGPVVEGGGQ
jgi:hypothetical protein